VNSNAANVDLPMNGIGIGGRNIEKPRVRMVVGRDFVIFYSPGRMIYYGKGQQATEVNW